MTSVLRPDEMQRDSEIRKAQGRTNAVRSGLETVGSIATGGIASSAAAKILPFVNQYIPADLALKGINKVMPHVGKFLQSGMSQGLTLESGLSFLKDNLGSQQSNEPAKQNGNIIEQFSPELYKFIESQIKSGRSPVQAGQLAELGGKDFKEVIDKITKAHKTDWASIVQSVFGGPGMAIPQQGQGQPEQQQAPQQPQQGQAGAGSQKLMDIMNMINQKLGQ